MSNNLSFYTLRHKTKGMKDDKSKIVKQTLSEGIPSFSLQLSQLGNHNQPLL